MGLIAALVGCHSAPSKEGRFVSYQVDLRRQTLRLYWRDDAGQPLRSLQRLADWLRGRKQNLVFGMNAGMYKAGNVPLGLFIQDARVITPLDTTAGSGNFYLLPNGVFYITATNKAVVCPTAAFRYSEAIAYATQSGPMLVVEGRIHPAFKPGSPNLNIRNGVGVLPDGRVLFAMSRQPISLYDFAEYFRQQGCRNALYLDGLVSRTYAPKEQWVQTDGDFGVMIGVSEPL
ncbi:phosphodiester glycosidase family protein [Hymenobacter cellulosilyticus]|uniref:Phosphodiester glycosidase family protein n=1 Tax=Hymenobacter cellulosilyticus TaxID=2932248 RepID=A0A8T9Q6D9_9BACT|nr:phosphodiester glycosidase family protein [Hymenobacter cellulosilyticus]UOQ71029.1 phosphodiester glycosidase family protein [Hymenobacter cellulosilyticus]